MGGFWEELVGFTRSFFNAAFKTNPYLERALMTGVTGVSKESFEILLREGRIFSPIEEQIVYDQLGYGVTPIWSFLLACGYLKVISYEDQRVAETGREPLYEMALTNFEVTWMFRHIIRTWFTKVEEDYNDFIMALLEGDLEAMNEYMNWLALQTFSFLTREKVVRKRSRSDSIMVLYWDY